MIGSLTSCGKRGDWDDDNSGPGRSGAYERDVQKSKPRNNPSDSQEYELHHRAQLNSPVKGIYISQATVENRQYLNYLISRSKQAGINTFVIDLNAVSNSYERNILLVKNSGIRYVARVVVASLSGIPDRERSEAYWMSRFRLVDAAIRLGADDIQIDYVASKTPSFQDAPEVREIMAWFREKINNRAKLQIDVFAESSYKKTDSVEQAVPVLGFGQTVDAVCPMLYPSHFEPYQEHAKKPYDTIYAALTAIKQNYNSSKTPFELYPYIELSNYRHSFTDEQLTGYIHSQIKAVEDAKADGWYAWSAGNKYDRLFMILSEA